MECRQELETRLALSPMHATGIRLTIVLYQFIDEFQNYVFSSSSSTFRFWKMRNMMEKSLSLELADDFSNPTVLHMRRWFNYLLPLECSVIRLSKKRCFTSCHFSLVINIQGANEKYTIEGRKSCKALLSYWVAGRNRMCCLTTSSYVTCYVVWVDTFTRFSCIFGPVVTLYFLPLEYFCVPGVHL